MGSLGQGSASCLVAFLGSTVQSQLSNGAPGKEQNETETEKCDAGGSAQSEPVGMSHLSKFTHRANLLSTRLHAATYLRRSEARGSRGVSD
jgi:hypothetical protein